MQLPVEQSLKDFLTSYAFSVMIDLLSHKPRVWSDSAYKSQDQGERMSGEAFEKTMEAKLDQLYNVNFQGGLLPYAEAPPAHR